MNTFWLTGKEEFDKSLPDFDAMFKLDGKQPTPLPVTQGKPQPKRLLRPSVESGFSERNQGSVQNSSSYLGSKGTRHSDTCPQSATFISVEPAADEPNEQRDHLDQSGTHNLESHALDIGRNEKKRRFGTVDNIQTKVEVIREKDQIRT